MHKVALAADIEKAFLMVSVAKEDRNVLRFLWVDDVTMDDPEIILLRFKRVVFGVSSSPFLLNATIRHHLKKYVSTMPDTVARISRSIYVDDVAYGADNEDQAYQLYLESKSLLMSGGFNLRKFVTNSTPYRRKSTNKNLSYVQHHSLVTQTRTKNPTLSLPSGPAVEWTMENKGSLA